MIDPATIVAALDPLKIAELVIDKLIQPLIMGLIFTVANILYLRSRMKDVSEALATVQESQSKAGDQIVEVERKRLVCRLECSETYPTKPDLAGAVADQAKRFDALDEQVDKVHSRITALATQVSHIEGEMEAGKGRVRT